MVEIVGADLAGRSALGGYHEQVTEAGLDIAATVTLVVKAVSHPGGAGPLGAFGCLGSGHQ